MTDALPALMRVVDVAAPGAPSAMRVVERPLPKPADGEVLIRVAAAGVNRPDIVQRAGHYPPPPGANPALGLEVAGEVVACGAGAAGLAPGERVTALVNGGGYAEYCTAPVGQCLPWPRDFDAVHAAALPENHFTVWQNVFQIGRLVPGERLLVHGGTSGIGLTAIMLAAARGSRVIATAGSREKCDACLRYGAAAAINYKEASFAEAVREFTAGEGVDVVLDMIGGSYLQGNLQSLADRGRLVVIAVMGGRAGEADLTRIMQRRLTLTGSTMRPRTREEKAALAAELRRDVWPLLDAGRCRPVIDTVLPLGQVVQAHERMEADHIGKVVLDLTA